MKCDYCGHDSRVTVEWTLAGLAPFTTRRGSILASKTSRLCVRCGGAEQQERADVPALGRSKR